MTPYNDAHAHLLSTFEEFLETCDVRGAIGVHHQSIRATHMEHALHAQEVQGVMKKCMPGNCRLWLTSRRAPPFPRFLGSLSRRMTSDPCCLE